MREIRHLRSPSSPSLPLFPSFPPPHPSCSPPFPPRHSLCPAHSPNPLAFSLSVCLCLSHTQVCLCLRQRLLSQHEVSLAVGASLTGMSTGTCWWNEQLAPRLSYASASASSRAVLYPPALITSRQSLRSALCSLACLIPVQCSLSCVCCARCCLLVITLFFPSLL